MKKLFLIIYIGLITFKSLGQNILIITADDLNYNSLGFSGSNVDNISPNLDSLASVSLVYENFFVSTSNCHPSRQSILTGKYPHNYGSVGFKPIGPDNTTLVEALKSAGYYTGMMGKIGHAKPYDKFPWDFQVNKGVDELGLGRSPSKFKKFTDQFLQEVPDDMPFFLVVNSSDPHRAFANSSEEKELLQTTWSKFGKPPISRIISTDEITIPSWLPDNDSIKTDFANYYTSVYRLDETVGQVLNSLNNSRYKENTIVIFFSDHGYAFPLAKANVYLNSIRSPLIINWPDVIESRTDSVNFIPAIDLYPTILDLLGLDESIGDANLDGESFKSSIFDTSTIHSKSIFGLFNETAGEDNYEMRAVSTSKFHYIYNIWPSENKKFKFGPGLTFKTIESLEFDSAARAIYDKTVYRTEEELYLNDDTENVVNLVHRPEYSSILKEARNELVRLMHEYKDPEYFNLGFLYNPLGIFPDPLIIYPNPSTDKIEIQTNISIFQIEIFDSSGRSVEFLRDENIVDISKLKKGVYFMKISSANYSQSKKFIKK